MMRSLRSVAVGLLIVVLFALNALQFAALGVLPGKDARAERPTPTLTPVVCEPTPAAVYPPGWLQPTRDGASGVVHAEVVSGTWRLWIEGQAR